MQGRVRTGVLLLLLMLRCHCWLQAAAALLSALMHVQLPAVHQPPGQLLLLTPVWARQAQPWGPERMAAQAVPAAVVHVQLSVLLP